MSIKKIADDAWLLALGNANAVLLQDGTELTLLDAGFPGKEKVVLDAIVQLGRKPSDLKHLVFTHSHPDHIGSAAAIIQATGARTYMHPADAAMAEIGGPFRPMAPAPGLFHTIMHRLVWDANERMEPFKIDQHVSDGEELPFAGAAIQMQLAPVAVILDLMQPTVPDRRFLDQLRLHRWDELEGCGLLARFRVPAD